MNRIALPTILVLLGTGVLGAGPHSQDDRERDTVRVMTRNVYHGVDAEIFAVPSATSFPALLQGVRAVYEGYYARKFPARAAALAREIAETAPDLIGLQEVMLIRTQAPWDGSATPAATVELDYLQLLLDALEFQDLRYTVVAQARQFDIEMPALCSSAPAPCLDVRHTVRDVVLARDDDYRHGPGVRIDSVRTGQFSTICSLPSPVAGPIGVARGWVSADVKIRDLRFRFISTHLDGDCLPVTPAIQLAQMNEILSGPGTTSLPVVLVGDINSPADGTGVTYNALLDAGFSDAFVNGGGDPAAATCCQADDLMNPVSALSSRIDHVLVRDGLAAEDADIVGEAPADRTPGELWPSDHAGIVVTLRPNR
jgi:endonuclease/exonuclease/phosphatase family metal-dependent hydrolase